MVAAANLFTIKIEARQPNANARQQTEKHGVTQYVKTRAAFGTTQLGSQTTFLHGSPACFRLSFMAKIYYMSLAIFALLASLLKIRKTYLHPIKWRLPQPSEKFL